ncbi:hypothetical protein ABIE69_000515 [Rhodobacteraceae bacterium MBR-64]|jgi:hypothetical protein
MNQTSAPFLSLLRVTFGDPRAGMRGVLNMGLPLRASVELLVLTAVVSAVLSEISVYLAPMPEGAELVRSIAALPISVVLLQVAFLGIVVIGIDRIGRAMGGRGDLTGAVLVVAWVQVVMIALQLAQMLAMVLVPPFSMLIGLASIGIFFWMITNFITELHGFAQRGRVFAVVFAGFMVLAMVLAFVLTSLGFVPPMEM